MVMPAMKRRRASRKAMTSGAVMIVRRGGERAVVRADLGVGEEHHAERRRRELRVRDDDQRPVQVVPVGDDREHRERGDRRPGARHDDAPDDLELADAVEPRGLDDLVGKPLKNWRNRKIANTDRKNGTIIEK